MSYLKINYGHELTREINYVLDRLSKEKRNWVPDWVSHEVCQSHEHELTEEADFSRYNIWCNVREQVRKIINKRAPDKPEEKDPQLSLPGFKHLQTYYQVPTEDGVVAKYIYNMSDEEILAKADHYDKMSRSCAEHARELRRFNGKRHLDGVA